MKKCVLVLCALAWSQQVMCWGFYGHRTINNMAVFLLPPEMLALFKPNIDFLIEHSVDPDKRRYIVPGEGPRHYIDLDHYGNYPFNDLPRQYSKAIAKFGTDSLQAHGVGPWWLQVMVGRLTEAFRTKDKNRILKLAAETGHYMADLHVPLHTSSNHNGQFTNQAGIHGFWESRVPELLAEREWDFWIGHAAYIDDLLGFTWNRVLESAAATDSVLKFEKLLSDKFREDKKYSFEWRNGKTIRQYSSAFTIAYNRRLNGMVERRMRQAIFSVASIWYTAWINAGQPELASLSDQGISIEDLKESAILNAAWEKAPKPDAHE
ncbi:MAG TPA: zinc dependent phospholipase C family protein [Flavitalea sp.]|nr:zinc dependent phospholipase C family protein [Flavitalea sp.]